VNDTLQFPLPLLAYGPTVPDRLETVICHATFTTGQHRLKVLTPELVMRELGPMTNIPRPSKKLAAEDINAMALGCNFCSINRPENSSGYEYRLELCRRADIFLRSWKAKGRTIPWTRVPKNMVFEARDGNAATYRRFSALCALNAAVGSKSFAIVTANRIRAGMGGYASGRILFAADGTLTQAGAEILDERSDGWKPETRSQARTMLDNFVRSGLAHRFTPYRGSVTYYSKALSAEKIGEAILAKCQRSAQTPRTQKLGEAIRQAKQDGILLCGDLLLESPHNTDSPHNSEVATQSPPGNHPVATQSPHNAASNASLNATANASLNAEARADKVDEKVLKTEGSGTPPAPTIPTMEDAITFANGLTKKQVAASRIEEWLTAFTAAPKADWKKSLSRKILA
jgi:hypothetical protein